MKNSHLIALIILLIGVSVLVWIGAFSDSETDDTVKPQSTVLSEYLSETSTPEPTVAPATQTPQQTPANPTQAPINIDTVVINSTDFEKYDNEFQNWDSYFTENAADNQNYPYVKKAILDHIGEAKIVPSVRETLNLSAEDIRYIISNAQVDGEQEVYLTFSLAYDAPAGVTKILDLLDKYEIKATSFMTDFYMSAEGNVDIIKRIYNSGHKIGTRGPEESFLRSCTAATFAAEMRAIEKVFRSVVGDETARMNYYRPEIFSERTLMVASALGYTNVFKTFVTEGSSWTTDIVDAEGNVDYNLVCIKLFERASYDGSVPEMKCNDAVLGAFENYILEAKGSNITFKLFK